MDAATSAVVAHWHIARIGLLGINYAKMLPASSEDEERSCAEALNWVANCLVGLLNANPSTLRPLLDIHHIELVLASGTLRQAGRHNDHAAWLQQLVNYLSMRRFGNGQIPFLEGHNRLDLVFEYLGSGEKPTEYCDGSSVYLTVLQEIICSLPSEQRDPLLELVDRRLVQGLMDCGTKADESGPIDLMLWMPPADWHERILRESLRIEGEAIVLNLWSLGDDEPHPGAEVYSAIKKCVEETRAKREFTLPLEVPLAVFILACLKLGTPLPPEFWRTGVFQDSSEESHDWGIDHDQSK